MSSEDYNAEQMESGNLRPEHLVEIIKFWQKNHGLEEDGYCGPKTIATFETFSPSRLGVATLSVAIKEIGNGEEGGNNSGQHVARYKGIVDDGDPDDDGAWCASFISYCSGMAADDLGTDLPFKKSGGAKRLYKNIGNAGSFITNPRPGDVVCWDRGDPGSWQGHIGIVERVENGILYTVEGNVGRFPSTVQRFKHDLSRQTRLEGFARMLTV
jgi:hypothetical protein